MKVELIFKDAWNTGRQYSESGQRIAVYEVLVEGKVKALFMVDVDRHLEYFYELPYSWAELRNHVMTKYDQNSHLDVWSHGWYRWIGNAEALACRDARHQWFQLWRA